MKFLIAFSLFIFSTSVFATEVLVWNKNPLDLEFQVGVERVIEFPTDVRVGVPPQLVSHVSANSAGGVVYFVARSEFPKTRFAFVLADTGKQIFIDISASPKALLEDPAESVRVTVRAENSTGSNAESGDQSEGPSVGLVELVRYASKDFYAPPRLRVQDPRVTVKRVLFDYSMDSLFMGASASAFDLTPIKEYVTSNYTLTAVLVKNKTQEARELVFKDAYPAAKAVGSQHRWLGPKDSDSDTTIMFVIADGQSFLRDGVFAR
ncbi:TIGR03749 family integrating conjugative element protein [Vibrio sp. PNB22_3_1]